MTVKELIENLRSIDPETKIVMSKDAEGNGFSPLSEIDPAAWYQAETTWSGDVLHPDDYDPDDAEGLEKVVCFWPVN